MKPRRIALPILGSIALNTIATVASPSDLPSLRNGTAVAPEQADGRTTHESGIRNTVSPQRTTQQVRALQAIPGICLFFSEQAAITGDGDAD